MKKTILISGAGSGIGRAISKTLADAGNSIILLGRNRQPLEETLALLDIPSEHSIITADIRDAQSIRAGMQELNPVFAGCCSQCGFGW